jgi:hypothetical protein
LNHTAFAIIVKLKSDGNAVDGDESACEEMRRYSGIEKTDYIPHCSSGEAQLTVVLPLWCFVSKEIMRDRRGNIPVVADNCDGRAAQADGDVESGEVESKESGDGRGSSGAAAHHAVAALGRVLGGGGGRAGAGHGSGGSKGLNETKVSSVGNRASEDHPQRERRRR